LSSDSDPELVATVAFAYGQLKDGESPLGLESHNEGNFTPLGRVTRGMDVVDRLELGDAVTAARVVK
jgi:hypothetical protein